jgi:DNA-binding transcriptional MerR regulator
MPIGSKALSDKTGATYRQIDYWCRIGLISPIGKSTPGSGYYRQFDEEVVPRVALIVRMTEAFNHTFKREVLKDIYDCYEDGSYEIGEGITITWSK